MAYSADLLGNDYVSADIAWMFVIPMASSVSIIIAVDAYQNSAIHSTVHYHHACIRLCSPSLCYRAIHACAGGICVAAYDEEKLLR